MKSLFAAIPERMLDSAFLPGPGDEDAIEASIERKRAEVSAQSEVAILLLQAYDLPIPNWRSQCNKS